MPKRIALLFMTTALCSCSLAPDFELPDLSLPTLYKEAPAQEISQEEQKNWIPAKPLAAEERGQWWKIFGDGTLDDLEAQAISNNQSLQAAASRVEQSRQLAEKVVPSLIPDLDIGGNAVRSKPSDAGVVAFGGAPGSVLKPYNLYSGGGILSYEADLFGRVRDNYKAASFDADAQGANYHSVLLALQADVAQHYFQIRSLDGERALLRDTVTLREEAYRIMQKKFELGEVGEQDYSRTLSELASAQSELLALDRGRALLDHALAVLLGKLPSEFTLPEASLDTMPPAIPPGLPSALLQRRPDIAQATAQMAASNARIGVARSAFLPRITLTATGGFESTDIGDLFQWSSRNWALGQTAGQALAMPIFDSGRNWSNLEAAEHSYDASVADYRQQVLIAFRDVEDALVGQRLLAQQSNAIETAAAASKRTYELTQLRYDAGDVDHSDLVTAQRDALSTGRSAIQLRGERFVTTVTLIRALGGGWEMPDSVSAPAETPAPPMLTPLLDDKVSQEAPKETPKETPPADVTESSPEPNKESEEESIWDFFLL